MRCAGLVSGTRTRLDDDEVVGREILAGDGVLAVVRNIRVNEALFEHESALLRDHGLPGCLARNW